MHNPLLIKTFVAGSNIRAHRLLKFDGDKVVEAAQGDRAIGVAELDACEGDFVDIVVAGIAEILASDHIDAGVPIAVNSEGRAQMAGSGANVFGISLESADNDDLVGVLIGHHINTNA